MTEQCRDGNADEYRTAAVRYLQMLKFESRIGALQISGCFEPTEDQDEITTEDNNGAGFVRYELDGDDISVTFSSS